MHGGRFEEFYFQNGLIYFIGVLDAGNFLPKTKGHDLQCFSYRIKKYMYGAKKNKDHHTEM